MVDIKNGAKVRRLLKKRKKLYHKLRAIDRMELEKVKLIPKVKEGGNTSDLNGVPDGTHVIFFSSWGDDKLKKKGSDAGYVKIPATPIIKEFFTRLLSDQIADIDTELFDLGFVFPNLENSSTSES